MSYVVKDSLQDMNFGQELRVSGNVPALGCNERDRAVRLVTTPADYPIWNTLNGKFIL